MSNKNNQIKITTKSSNEEKFKSKRESAQIFTYSVVNELIQRNVSKNLSRTYTQYAKDAIKGYLQNPASNLDNIREVSRFLERNSTLYKKILMYYAATPLFYYNLIQINDYMKSINESKVIKKFQDVSKQINGFNIKKDMYNAIYQTVRDGMYVGFEYSDGDNRFLMPLDIKYCRIRGKNTHGEWVVYFNAAFFSGDNVMYVEGIDGDTSGCWDSVFVDGYNAYKNDRNMQWFRLPPERTFAMISGSDDQFDVPLPLLVGLFINLMDLQDMEQILADKTELENYKLLINKIPLVKNSNDVDDFALSLSLAKDFHNQFDGQVPALVGLALSPGFETEVIDFNKSNTTEDTDKLAQSIQNLFNNAGVSQIVVAGGLSSSSIGLKHALENDSSNIWLYVNRIESWINFYISQNISEGYLFYIHPITWFNREDYIKEKKDIATLGGSALDYLTACGDTPYIAWQKINFENILGIKSLMIPLKSSYTDSANNGENSKPKKNDDDLSESGQATRDLDKNGTENI